MSAAKITRRFDSVASMVEYSRRPLPQNANDSAQRSWASKSQSHSNSANWCGLPAAETCSPISYAEQMLRNGWTAGVTRMEAAMGSLNEIPVSTSVRRRGCWADAGDSLDMGKVWAGQLETAWRRTTRKASQAPRPVTIWLLAGLSCMESTDAIFWRGAACATLANRLTQAGYAVGITAYNCEGSRLKYGRKGPKFDFQMVIKPHSAPLDIATLAATVALPATIRGAFYNALVIAGQEDKHQIGGGIFAIENNPCHDVQPGDFAGLDKVTTHDAALAWVNACIAQLTEQTTN